MYLLLYFRKGVHTSKLYPQPIKKPQITSRHTRAAGDQILPEENLSSGANGCICQVL